MEYRTLPYQQVEIQDGLHQVRFDKFRVYFDYHVEYEVLDVRDETIFQIAFGDCSIPTLMH